MSLLISPRLPLPDPNRIEGIDPGLREYLIRLNNELQNFVLDTRRTFKANMQTGTLVLDDGVNWRVTAVFQEGRVSSITTEASSGATAAWS